MAKNFDMVVHVIMPPNAEPVCKSVEIESG
jgi:hypothetical protein